MPVEDGYRRGLNGESFQVFLQFCNGIQSSKPIRDRVSLEFVIESAFDWLVESSPSNGFSEYFLSCANDVQVRNEYWIPVAASTNSTVDSCW